MFKQFTLFAGLLFTVLACGMLNPSISENDVLFTVDENPVSVEEFKYVYEKNNFNNDSIYTREDIDSYLQLFINFKLKVRQAREDGYDTLSTFRNEFETYKKQLAKPYLTETKVNEQLVAQAYERLKQEVHAAHILIRLPQDPTPEDTINAYNKIADIHQKAVSGADFSQLAKNNSEDPSAKKNGGDLGYFTVFQMVYPFEEAAYNTPVGGISDIIRTQFGYHILKVIDKRPSLGKVKVAHIMLRLASNPNDSIAVMNKIYEIHEQLMAGEDWDLMCRQFSEDTRTKNNGGSLPYLSTGQVDPAFSDAAFSLPETGDISDPFATQYGMHIIKLEDRSEVDSFEDVKKELETKVRRDARSQINKKVMIDKLKMQHGFLEDEASLGYTLTRADSSLLRGDWSFSEKQLSLEDTLFNIGTAVFTISDFFDYVLKNQRQRSNISPTGYLEELYNSYVEACLMEYEMDHIYESNTEYRLLLNEYYEGILLFNIMEDKVWSKASSDSLGLASFFDDHREDFKWGTRMNSIIFDASNREIIDHIKEKYLDLPRIDIDSVLLSKERNMPAKTKGLINQYLSLGEPILELKFHPEMEILKDSLVRYLVLKGVKTENIMENDTYEDPKGVLITLASKSKKSLEILFNKESALNLQITEGKFEKGDQAVLDEILWQPGIYEKQWENRFFLIEVDEILTSQPKELDDVKGMVISRYQDYLEKNWIAELKNKYPVVINDKVLNKTYKYFEAKIPLDR